MKRFIGKWLPAVLALAAVAGLAFSPAPAAAEDIHVIGSSQMYHAFIKDSIEPFAKAAGVKVTADDRRSRDAAPGLVAGKCNVGATAEKLSAEEKAQDAKLTEILVARDHIAVFVPKGSAVTGLSKDQLRKVMAGEIKDWSAVGGAAGPITVVIPQSRTACNKNFSDAVMGDAQFSPASVVSSTAGDVLNDAKGKPAISFISYGAVSGSPDFKVVKVDGKSPDEAGYPIAQDMYLLTLGPPAGAVKQYIDFFLTGAGKDIIKKAGLAPAK